MSFLPKLRHWELILMLAAPTLLCFLLRIPFGRFIVTSLIKLGKMAQTES
ncbi:MAG: hypothetical protein ACI9LO_001259 [Planctomycetota bacterium]|jgi:hypothetical protein